MHALTRHCLILLAALILQGSSAAQVPRVDVKDAPERYKDLIKRGNVSVIFAPSRNYDAETRFAIYLNYNYSFKSRPVRTEVGFAELITISLSNLRVRIENEIRLPPSLANSDFWESRLLEHEFEHVQVNTDPRVFMLAETVLRTNNQIQIPTANPGVRASRQQVNQLVEKRLQENVKICEDLVRKNNKLLDRITQHGMTTLESEPNFFRRLYTKENLQEQEFAAMPYVTALLRNRRYTKYQKESYEPN